MATRRLAILLFACLAAAVPVGAYAQSSSANSREAAITLGAGRLSHGDDGLGTGLTLGGSLSIPVARRVSVRFEGHRSIGPEVRERTCATYQGPCSGTGRYGVRDLTIWSGNLLFYFTPEGIQPFVMGGVDVLHFNFLSDVTYAGSVPIRITEFEIANTTMGILVGGGVRVPVGSRVSITPELGIYDGTILAGANLTQLRTAVGIGYRW